MIIIILVLLMCVCISVSIGVGVWFYLESQKEKDVDAVWGEWETDVSCKGDCGGQDSQKRVCTPATGKGKSCREVDTGKSTRLLDCLDCESFKKIQEIKDKQKLDDAAAEATRIAAEQEKKKMMLGQNIIMETCHLKFSHSLV